MARTGSGRRFVLRDAVEALANPEGVNHGRGPGRGGYGPASIILFEAANFQGRSIELRGDFDRLDLERFKNRRVVLFGARSDRPGLSRPLIVATAVNPNTN